MNEANVSGSLSANEAKFRNAKISGRFDCEGDAEAEEFLISGPVFIKGLLNAENVDIKLGFRKFTNVINSIGGTTIRIELREEAHRPFAKTVAKTIVKESIEGDAIFLENTECPLVVGKNVIIGEGCKIGKVQYTNAVNSGTINSKNSPMYRLDDEGERIPISEDDYRRITDPAKKDGADIRIANSDDEDMAIVLKRMREQDASAVTYGATVILRDDATISDVLEEVHHFYQNKNGLNDMYGYKERTILNEIDAKEYLLSVQKDYNIPLNEVKTTENQLKSYRRQMEELKASGEWNEPN